MMGEWDEGVEDSRWKGTATKIQTEKAPLGEMASREKGCGQMKPEIGDRVLGR